MRIAVAGSKGFVGRNVCSILEKAGHSVISIDLADGLDLCDASIINMVPELDVFIHLANLVYVPESYKDPAKYYRINYMTTLNALEICRKFGAKLIYISSYIYGTPQYLPVDESHPICPFNPYAQTKVICEMLCEGYQRDFGIKVSILRPFNLYGTGQKGKLLIPEIISQIKEGKTRIQLKAANPRRDFVNVVDLARAILLCVEIDASIGPFNVCTGRSISVREITEIINSNLQNKVEFVFSVSDRPNEVDETRGSYDSIKAMGWEPTICFEDGVKEILSFENLL